MADEVEVFQTEGGRFDWRKVARRGNLPDAIVATSGNQGYNTRHDATDAAARENPGLTIIQIPADE